MSVSEPTPRSALSEAKRRLLEERLRGRGGPRPIAGAGGAGAGPIARRLPDDGPAPLSFAQQRLWFLDRLDPGGSAYNLPKVVRIEGDLDVGRFERVLGEIVRRHEVLRTSFPERAGRPVQEVAPWRPVRIPRIDLSALAAPERDAEVRRLAGETGSAPFDLARGPLWRARLLRTGAAEHVLLLTLHHAVSDGWSTGVLVRELGELYRAFAAGSPSPLPELPIQYSDFAAWEREHLSGAVLESKIAYWRAKLAGVPALDLPFDRAPGPRAGAAGDRRRFTLSSEVSEALVRVARSEGVTDFTLLLTGFAVLLARYTGEDDVCVGSPVAGRTRTEVEPLIGFFVNTVALRNDLSGRPRFRDALVRVRETVLEAHDHQEVPFEKLVEELAPDRDLDRAPLFQVVFSLLGGLGEAVEMSGARLTPIEVENRTAKFDLTIAMTRRGGRFTGSIEYRTALFEDATIERLAGHWQNLLAAVAAAPERLIEELPLFGPAERRQLTSTWGGQARRFDDLRPLHLEFIARAVERPDAIAVVIGGRMLSYGELRRRAGAGWWRIARWSSWSACSAFWRRGPPTYPSIRATRRSGETTCSPTRTSASWFSTRR